MKNEQVTPEVFDWTVEVLNELRKVHVKEFKQDKPGNYADRFMLIKLITQYSTISLDRIGYGRALAQSGDMEGVFIWNYHWMVHYASIFQLALVYGRLVQFDVPKLEQFNSSGTEKLVNEEKAEDAERVIEAIRGSIASLSGREHLIVDALYLIKRLCKLHKLPCPEWWLQERNKVEWKDESGNLFYEGLDLSAF